MRERAEAAIADEDVAFAQLGMDCLDLRHVVRPQRRGDQAQQQAGGRIEERQQVHDREAAARLLGAGLAKSFLQLGRIGRGGAGAVDQKGAVAAPEGVGGRLRQAITNQKHEALEQGERQSASCLAIRLAAAVHAAEARYMIAGRVAVQDLQEEEMNGSGWIENAFAPAMFEGAAQIVDRSGREPMRDIRLDPFDGSDNTMGHPWPPFGMGGSTTILHGGLDCFLAQLQLRTEPSLRREIADTCGLTSWHSSLGQFLHKRGWTLPEMKPKRVGITVGVAAALLLAFFFLPLPVGRVREVALIQVRPEATQKVFVIVPGTLVKLHVRDGQRVEAGDVLAEFESMELERQLEDARSEHDIRVVHVRVMREQVAS